MSWLPRISHSGHTVCVDDGEFEGSSISLWWLGFVVEFTFARRDRYVPARETADAR